jgi:hypothetical protein
MSSEIQRRFEATVYWEPVPNRAMTSLLDTYRYIDMSYFEEDGPWPPDEGWSVVLDFERSPMHQGTPSEGFVSFLVPNAPHERLRPGRRFEIRRGPHKVAEVVVGQEDS